MLKLQLRAFTLVELIVVITIVGILSTIGFVSYSGYLSGARDSNRMSQLTKISDSLQVYAATKSLPLPDDYVEIQASGSTIAYQGEVGVDVLETIDYTNGGKDPKDDSYYTYYLTKDRKSLQLMALMEEQGSVAYIDKTKQFNPSNIITNNTYASDYSDRFPKVYGRKLGTLTQVDTNTPIQQLSTYQNTPFELFTETGYRAYFDDINTTENLTILSTVVKEGGYISSTLVWYDMSTEIGGELYNMAGNGNNAIKIGSNITTGDSSGVFGNSTQFEVAGGYQIPFFNEIQDSTLTISIWAKTDSQNLDYNSLIGQWDCSISCDNEGGYEWWIGITDHIGVSSGINFISTGTGRLIFPSTSINTYGDGKWHNYIIIKNNRELTLYLDGVLVDSTITQEEEMFSTLPVYIGTSGHTTSASDHNGEIDEVRIFDKAFDKDEVIRLYNAGKSGL